jgi:hypothetical protein
MSSLSIQRQVMRVSIATAIASTVLSPGRAAIVSAQATVQPFYLTQTISAMNLTTGVFGPFCTKTIARRANGMTVVVDGFVAATGQIRKVMSPNGDATTIWEVTRLKTTWPANDREALELADRLENSTSDCRAPRLQFDEHGQPFERLLGFETRNGQHVAVIEQRMQKFVATGWKAPALACEELSYTAEDTQPDGSTRRTIDSVTTFLRLGEPDSRLFDIDSVYAESKPSAGLMALWRSMISSTLDSKELAGLRREGEELDRLYGSAARPKNR